MLFQLDRYYLFENLNLNSFVYIRQLMNEALFCYHLKYKPKISHFLSYKRNNQNS